MKLTINGVAAKLGAERDVAYHLVKFLEAVDLAKKTGDQVKASGAKGKGKGADVYEIAESVVLTGKIDLLLDLGREDADVCSICNVAHLTLPGTNRCERHGKYIRGLRPDGVGSNNNQKVYRDYEEAK